MAQLVILPASVMQVLVWPAKMLLEADAEGQDGFALPWQVQQQLRKAIAMAEAQLREPLPEQLQLKVAAIKTPRARERGRYE